MIDIILSYGLRFLVLMPAIIVHEVSHGYVSYLLGDPTAKRAGRLTANPISHIDLWGTILMPLLLLVGSGGRFSFGYAKPVPINPNYYHNHRVGVLLTGLAGPASNVVLAAISGLLARLVGTGMPVVGDALVYFTYLNLVLVFFNLIPIPPLDGSRVIPMFLSDAGLRTYYEAERYGFAIILALLWLVPRLTGGWDPIGTYLTVTTLPLTQLFAGSIPSFMRF